MSSLYNSVSVGNDHPDLLLTTQTLFEKYEALLQPRQVVLTSISPEDVDARYALKRKLNCP
jgi:hypothetical protein